MRFLLDTHILLWWLADSPRLNSEHRVLIADGSNTAFASSMSIAEISIKASLGKLEAPSGIAEAVEQSGFQTLPFTASHAKELRTLPWHHRDPFDRMLISQARIEKLTFLTSNRLITQYDVEQV